MSEQQKEFKTTLADKSSSSRHFVLQVIAAQQMTQQMYTQHLKAMKNIYSTILVNPPETERGGKFCDGHIDEHIACTQEMGGFAILLFEGERLVGSGFCAASGQFPLRDNFLQLVNDKANDDVGFVQMLRGWFAISKKYVDVNLDGNKALHVYTTMVHPDITENVEGVMSFINDTYLALAKEAGYAAILGTAMNMEGYKDDLVREDTVPIVKGEFLQFVVTPTGLVSDEELNSTVVKPLQRMTTANISTQNMFEPEAPTSSSEVVDNEQEINDAHLSSHITLGGTSQ